MKTIDKISNILASSINEAFKFNDIYDEDTKMLMDEEATKDLYKSLIKKNFPELSKSIDNNFKYKSDPNDDFITMENNLIYYISDDSFLSPASRELDKVINYYNLKWDLYNHTNDNINKIPAKYIDIIEQLFDELLICPLYYPFQSLSIYSNKNVSFVYLKLESYANYSKLTEYHSMDILIFDLSTLTKN